MSKLVDFIETEDNLCKVDPNESGSLNCFACVRWYVEKDVSLESKEGAESLVGWALKFILMNLQR